MPSLSTPPEVSVVIPCLNAADTLPEQLDALAAQQCDRPWEILVVDNGSSDTSAEVVASYQKSIPHLRLLEASDEQSSAYAANVGVVESTGEFLLFCDADDVVAPGWLQAMVDGLDAHDFVAGSLDWNRLNPDWTVGDRAGGQSTEFFRFGKYGYAASCNMGVLRSTFTDVDGFDQRLTNLKDLDFCVRVQKSGTPLTFIPEALVYYRTRHTLRGTYKQARGYARTDVLLRSHHGFPVKLKFWSHLRKQLPHQIRGVLGIRSREDLFRWGWRFGWFVGTLEAARRVQRGEEALVPNVSGHHGPHPKQRNGVSGSNSERTPPRRSSSSELISFDQGTSVS